MVLEIDEIEQAWKEKHPKSRELFEEAVKYVPGGSHHHSMIAFWHTERGMYPPYIAKAQGPHIWDVDGNMYADYYNHGALFLGHAHPAIIKAIREIAPLGPFSGDFSEIQIKHMKKIIKMVPSAEMIKFCMSGTEATMYAIRIARTHTKRQKVVKLAGHFHGCQDQLFTDYLGHPPFARPYNTAGVPNDCFKNTVVVKDGDVEALEKAVKKHEPAAVIFCFAHGSASGGMAVGEPNTAEYLKALREITSENGVVLIADEVITGFRLAPGGGQEFFSADVDLTVFGKMVAGGIPGAGAVAGKSEFMEATNPKTHKPGEYAATCGTFSGNPLCSAAGHAALDVIDRAGGGLNRHGNELGERFRNGLNDLFERYEYPAQAVGCGSMNGVVFTEKLPVRTCYEARAGDPEELYKYRLWLMTHAGIYTTGAFFISAVHTYDHIDDIISATEDFIKKER